MLYYESIEQQKFFNFLSLTEIIDILCRKQAARDCSFGFQNIKKNVHGDGKGEHLQRN